VGSPEGCVRNYDSNIGRGVQGEQCRAVCCVVMRVTSVRGMYVAVEWCPGCPGGVCASSRLCSSSTCGPLSGHASVVAGSAFT
jgi:hypothetical protein